MIFQRQEMSMSSKASIWASAALMSVAAAWQSDTLAAASNAPAAGDVEQTTVQFGELNLDRPEGAAVLYRRIRHAAERVCGEPKITGSRIISPNWRSCVAKAVDRAVLAVDRPALTAYHRGHAAPSDRGTSRV
jgi:UrcA family protein